MRITIDKTAAKVSVQDGDQCTEVDLYSGEAFEIIAEQWVKLGWSRKYSYGFSWLGRPIIQLPDDMVRIQEAIFEVKPDVIIETGIAHGGSLIYYASLLEMIGKGRVIGIDVDIRPHNRTAIESHPMAKRIEMVEGSSIDPATVSAIRDRVADGDTVMLILDSNHTRDHVAAELEAYGDLVTPGSYLLSQDGVMQMVAGMPGSKPGWEEDNPITAVKEFLSRHPEFELAKPSRPFDETLGAPDCSHHPVGWLQRRNQSIL